MENTTIAPENENGQIERERNPIIGTARFLWFILSVPFLVLREMYWALDTDAAVRANGEQTQGEVTGTKTETHTYTDSETGEKTTVTEHYVTYRYEGQGGAYTARKKVQSLGGIKEGSKIRVYYRTPTDRLVTEKDSALDW